MYTVETMMEEAVKVGIQRETNALKRALQDVCMLDKKYFMFGLVDGVGPKIEEIVELLRPTITEHETNAVAYRLSSLLKGDNGKDL